MDKVLLIITSVIATVVMGAILFVIIQQRRRIRIMKRNISFVETLNLTGFPVISFKNNGKIINMILDTGSNSSIIDSTICKELEHTPINAESNVFGLSGTSIEGGCSELPITYKNRVYTVTCITMDMSATFKKMKEHFGITIHGILGTDFFRKYQYILDFNEMVAYSLKKQ